MALRRDRREVRRPRRRRSLRAHGRRGVIREARSRRAARSADARGPRRRGDRHSRDVARPHGARRSARGMRDRRAMGRGLHALRSRVATSAFRARCSSRRSASTATSARRSGTRRCCTAICITTTCCRTARAVGARSTSKGVVGELEYELGAALRNPIDRPDLFASLEIVERRLDHFGLALGIDTSRARGWCFAQAVLAAIWSVEDGGGDAERDAALALARVLLDSSALRGDFLD